MNKLKLPELLARLKKEGINITKRTFEYYQRLGLLPKPEKHVGKGGRGLYGYYDPVPVIETIKIIHELQKKGRSLSEIIEAIESEVIDRFYGMLRGYGFSHDSLPELFGYDKKNIEEGDKLIREFLSEEINNRFPTLDDETKKILAEGLLPETDFRCHILSKLKWWYSDELYEFAVCEHIREKVNSHISGLIYAIKETFNEYHDVSSGLVKEAIFKLACKFQNKLKELVILKKKIDTRLKEIEHKYTL